ncbi:MAG: glycogen debranching protein GlgX [Candidatus Thiodiazotropha sp. (ex Epidulcina cf. delphinae)]|nr:glycogen debranching protein GlgX [Candidatus Thiodiazotropha sp. (ex Epidulcina cf. delphinae)]
MTIGRESISELVTAEPGQPHPFGATPDAEGVNFALFSEHATRVVLLIFDSHSAEEASLEIELDPIGHRTFHVWHVYVRGLKPGTHYAYRVDGPSSIHDGHRFDPEKVLVDPYSCGNTDTLFDRGAAVVPGDNQGQSMRSVVIDTAAYDWEGDQRPATPMKDTVIYEMHVGGFTRASASGVSHPGTFRSVIDKISYLQALGVTAVELLPVFEFDAKHPLRVTEDGRRLMNYWGYSTIGFFAPESSYCVQPEEGRHLDEFRDMVKALHAAGIEVILDVVYNHTDEGNHQGPSFSFKGIDNRVYYHTVPSDRQYYMDYTGCGNTLNCNHPLVAKFITDSLRFWVEEMHVDGFRFDEGSVLSRGEDGVPTLHAHVLWNIELDEALAGVKLIAEAWDAAGAYQIGAFPGWRWGEWNGRYRDSIRRFVKGDPGLVGDVAARIAGSADIYEPSGHTPNNSINFITCHDGFTLADLVSYNGKHNLANGEENRDGADDNMSWNCGAEGSTGDDGINRLRQRQIKNFAAILLLSQGVPMILSGDEIGRSQGGNNNAYCQDNEINWLNWQTVETNAELLRFFKNMIALRKANESLRRGRFFDGATNDEGVPDVAWHGCRLDAPGWFDQGSRVLAFTLRPLNDGEDYIHVMLNMDGQPLDFEVPALSGSCAWRRYADTAQQAPDDIADPGSEQPFAATTYTLAAHSTVILVGR